MALNDPRVTLVFGLLGNVVSFSVYLAPLPTFYRIYKRKSTEEFQSIAYSVALFSAMLTLYYATLKTDALMLITINCAGCVIESIYLVIYLIYAPKSTRIYTLKLLMLFNVGACTLIVLMTSLFSHGSRRIDVVGWICAVFSVCVFAAPLTIIVCLGLINARKVIRTKSVEYMPFSLSFFLTLCAICWFVFGVSQGDWYIASPNILGLVFGIAQMMLYFIYRNKRNEIVLPETQSQAQLAIAADQRNKDETIENSNAQGLNQREETV